MVVGVDWLTLCQECRRVHAVLGQLLFLQLLFLLYTSDLYVDLNKVVGYPDDSTFIAVVPSPGFSVEDAESVNHDLGKVSEWCDICGKKLNASKNKTMIVFRLRIMDDQLAPLTIDRTELNESDDLDILGVTLNFKINFE